jgi:hypothetical protein
MNIQSAFETAINNLEQTNQTLCDYWMSELCDENGDLLNEKMTEQNLNMIEKDVAYQYGWDCDYVMENDYED